MTGLILDHIWQSTLFAAVAGLLTFFLRANSAKVRYGIWLSASLKFLFPLALLTAGGTALSNLLPSQLPVPPLVTALSGAAQPFSIDAGPMVQANLVPAPLWNWELTLALVWFVGFALIVTLWINRWLNLTAIARSAVPVAINAPLPVKSSSSLLEPGLVGIFRPVLLLPTAIANQFSTAELDTIIAHELCHWRRRDNLTAMLHMLVEALFWFYPLVWWLETRLIAERERACDEAVLAGGRDPALYAESILKVCKYYVQSPLACVAGISGARLKKRMEEIMAERLSSPLSVTKTLTLIATAVAVIVAPVSLGLLATPPAIAQAETSGPRSGTEAAVREQIEGWEKRQPVTDSLMPSMINDSHQQQAFIQKMFDGLGPLQSVVFKGRDEHDWDFYLATFEHGLLGWSIAPLVNGKINDVSFSPAIIRSDNGPSPGTQDALSQIIVGFSAGSPAYQIMVPTTVNVIQQHLKGIEDVAKALGPLKTLTFKNVDGRGWDSYHATYENGEANWFIQPLIDGKASGFRYQNAILNNAKAHPEREASLRHYIESLENGAPNYNDMTPRLATDVRQQLPDVLETIKSFGQLLSISFEHRTAQGEDVYLATFEHGKIEWYIGALTVDGKAQERDFEML